MPSTAGDDRGAECEPEFVLELSNGNTIRTGTYEGNPAGSSYVRICAPGGRETGYWAHTEWSEDPQLVMGAILGAAGAANPPAGDPAPPARRTRRRPPAPVDGPVHPDLPTGQPVRMVAVVAPDGTCHRFTVTGESTVTVLVDDQPVLGVDQRGPGRWHGEQWQRLHPADSLVDRSVAIEGISTQQQWRDLETALGLPPGDLGRFKPWAADQPKNLSGKLPGGRVYDLDAAVTWARQHSLAYEDEQRVRADARPAAG